MGLVWILATLAGAGPWWAAGISFVVGFTVRVIALYRASEEPLAEERAGVYRHSDGRAMLGRKLAGSRSARFAISVSPSRRIQPPV